MQELTAVNLESWFSLLGLVFLLFSWRWWWLTPSSLVALFMGHHGIIFSGVAATALSLVLARQQLRVWLKRPCYYLLLLSLMGALLCRQDILTSMVAFLLPWSLWALIKDWMAKNSGGGAIWVPIFLAILLEALIKGNFGVGFATMSFFLILLSWYRQLPRIILSQSMILGTAMILWLLAESPLLAIMLMAILLIQMCDKWLWGSGSCSLRFWAWAGGILLFLALSMTREPQANMSLIFLGLSIVMVWMGSQESCRLCVSVARCREAVVSIMGARVPLIFCITIILQGPDIQAWFWMMLIVLMSEAGRFTTLRPVKASDLLQSPCHGRWVKWILDGLKQ